MKAFTVYQPYAFAIVTGLKHYETRKKRTSIRGRVAVHAAKGTPRFVTMALDMALPEHMTLHYGAVIGTVEIVDCVPVEDIRDRLTEREEALGDYSLKNTRNASTAYFVSFTPAVSTAECMASWGSPMSTVETDTWAVEMLPRVLPPAMSERLA